MLSLDSCSTGLEKGGKSRPLACHFPGRKEAFRLALSELQDEEKRTRAHHLLYTETEISPPLTLPASAGEEEERDRSKQS